MSTILELNNIFHAYDNNIIINDISFNLKKGSIGCLLGQSGCGKTTILRTIAGFEDIMGGTISIEGNVVSRKGWTMLPEKRNIGMVFQDYALFPHLTVYENIAFGLGKKDRSEKLKRIKKMLDTVHLSDLHDCYPHELSGGQQQRVALARALIPRPSLLLMDEPFSNLDVELREKLSMEVREILKEHGITALLVTHNQHEAFTMADEIGVINSGTIQQWDSAYNIYHKPANSFVANFIGEGVVLHGTVKSGDEVLTGLGTLKGSFSTDYRSDTAVDILIRPEDIIHNDASSMKGRVVKKAFRGANILYTLELESGEQVMSLAPSHHEHPVGMQIGITPEVNDIVLFRSGALDV